MAKKKEKALAELTDDELMDQWTALGKEVEEGKAKLREFSQEHQKRTRFAQLNLQPGDLELVQEMAAEGIVSEEKVNTDG